MKKKFFCSSEKYNTVFGRLFLLFLICICSFSLFPATVFAAEESDAPSAKKLYYYDSKSLADFAEVEISNIDALSAIAVNIETGSVIYDKNPLQAVYPASTVKLMTAIVAIENIPDLDTIIYASEEAVKKSTGTRINPTKPIKPGEGFTARELLYGLLVTGANDAANVIAEYVGGSIDGFCEMMNSRAKELGAVYTNFTNPTGLHDPDMTSTAYDLAIIANHAYFINDLVKIAGATNYTIEATEKTPERRYLYNRNRMLRRVEGETDYFYKGTLGLSAGSTPEGGNCVISVAERGGLTYLAVVMGSQSTETENFAYRDSITLLDACFDNFSMQNVAAKGAVMCEIPVALAADSDHITLCAAEDITALLPNDVGKDKLNLKKLVYDDAKAPVSEGQAFGELLATYNDTIILGKTKLVANVTANRSNFLYILEVLRNFFTGRWFITAFISAVVIFIIYCIIYYKSDKRRRGFRR